MNAIWAIERYLMELDRADEAMAKTGSTVPQSQIIRTSRKLAHLHKEAERYRAVEECMDATGETQVSFSDPDAKSMTTTARMPRVVGYNVQTAVEAKHHLIVAHEVTTFGYDRDALSTMAIAAREAMGADKIEAIADKRVLQERGNIGLRNRRHYSHGFQAPDFRSKRQRAV